MKDGCPQAERWVTVWVCMWNSGDPLPGHRASSIPASAAGVVAGRPWPGFPRRSPPAGVPGPWCPFPLCAVVVAAFSLARAASAAQPSDWTSRQTETSSANTHPVQPRRHDNFSIHPSFPRLSSKPELRRAQAVWYHRSDKKSFSDSSNRQKTTRCVYIWLPPHPPDPPVNCTDWSSVSHSSDPPPSPFSGTGK